jgi:pyruvate,water dikinase
MMKYVRWLDGLSSDDVAVAGGKNAALGELIQCVKGTNARVPDGFAITADAYRLLVAENNLEGQLRSALAIVGDDQKRLTKQAAFCRELIRGADWPEDLLNQVLDAYEQLEGRCPDGCGFVVRSSATAEDLPEASFAGQHDSFLNVVGAEAIIDACRRCFASLFTDRAVRYRENQGFDHFDVALSVGVMRLVRADRGVSGVAFTLDTETGFRDVVLVNAAWGMGEPIVQGFVDPDEYYVHKPTFLQGKRAVMRRRRGEKTIKRVLSSSGEPIDVQTSSEERLGFTLSDAEMFELTEVALKIEAHFSERAGRPLPMDIEWAKDNTDGVLYVVQARPETVASNRNADVLRRYRRLDEAETICRGRAVGTGVASGPVNVVYDAGDLAAFQYGDVLVAETTSPDWGPVMRQAAALVTMHGGRTCHAAIVARELGIPAVVGCGEELAVFSDRTRVTVSCAEGQTGFVYRGEVGFEFEETEIDRSQHPKTSLMVNLGDPDLAFQVAALPSDGVGLARIEFIISEHIGIHPMALAHPERIEDSKIVAEIASRTYGYSSGAEFFVQRLSEGVGTIAGAFYPRPVIARLSDFKTNEYARLLGGSEFEPFEENPMLGFRGASRYAHPRYADGFALECAALKRVRGVMGFDNLKIMVPFCRRIDEARATLAAMARHGLVRGENGLEVYVMCEIPNNVISIDAFAELFDGFSIGSNDLTQLALGVDRDSEIVAFDFDERDPGVLKLIEMAIEGARRNGRACGICGQAPSDFPEVAEFLVRAGIDSISLSPDSLLQTRLNVLEIESRLSEQHVDTA